MTKLNKQQLQKMVAGWLYGLDVKDGDFDKLSLNQQSIYSQKAKVILDNIETYIKNGNNMEKYSQVIGKNLQNWFVAIDVASNSLLSPEVARSSGTITKDEAQRIHVADKEHSDLYLFLGQEGVDKIGADKLLAFQDLSLEKQYGILARMLNAVKIVAKTENDLSKMAEEKGYSLNKQIDGLNYQLDQIFDQIQEKE